MSWLPWRPPRSSGRYRPLCREPSADSGEVTLPAQDSLDRAVLADRENDDRHPVLAGKRERRAIHDLQVAVERLLMVEALVALGLRLALRIGGINPVDVGRLEHGVA